jgi:gliding motility-associated-like protein
MPNIQYFLMRILFAFLLLLQSIFCFSQHQRHLRNQAPGQKMKLSEPCGTHHILNNKLKTDTAFAKRHQAMEQDIYKIISSKPKYAKTATGIIYTIPVVVHIIHDNGPENISDAAVQQGIQDLNDAFAQISPYNGTGSVNVEIQFCLAKQDENGNFTTGINRVQSSLTNMTMETEDLALKNLSRWDPTLYMNIWLVREINSISAGSGVAGYAYFASSHGNPEDGIVSEAYWFGSSKNNSKIHIHEVGHYLNLYHTFNGACGNNNCLLDGDQVCDTPPDQSVSVTPCNGSVNSCQTDPDDLSSNNPFRNAGGLGDQDDMFRNYMDYGDQACQDVFTQGQKDRMIAAITGPRNSLLSSIGCNTLCTSNISIDFNPSSTTVIVGNSVNFTNSTTGALSYQWKINGIQFSSAVNSSYTFNTQGTYNITLVAMNADSSCTKKLTKTITVNCTVTASFTPAGGNFQSEKLITFNYTGSGASSYKWYLNSSFASSASSFSYYFSEPGNFSVMLKVSNGICSDSMYKIVNISGVGSTDELQVFSDTPANLVRNLLLCPGISVSNISYTGDPGAIGGFRGGQALGTRDGLILCSGPKENALPGSDGLGMIASPGDADLTNLQGGQTYNAAVLEFDFTPIYDTIGFRYIFASYEYPEFACSPFNDVFAFFLSGPGITGTKNLALIPGTSLPVTVNNVNNGNPLDPFCIPSYPQYYIDNQNHNITGYDAYTINFTAKEKVNPGSVYHIKIAIADVSDEALDSGVLIEGKNFGCSKPDVVIRNFCQNDSTTFSASSSKIASVGYTSVLWKFGDGGTSSAINTKHLYQNPGWYTVSFLINYTDGSKDTVITNIKIDDNLPFSISLGPDTAICPSLILNGGFGFDSYLWNDGSTNSQLNVSNPGQYWVRVENECGISASDTINLRNYNSYLDLGDDKNICPGEEVTVLHAGSAFNWYKWHDMSTDSICTVWKPGTYWVTAADSCGIHYDTIKIVSNLDPSNINISIDSVSICQDQSVKLRAELKSCEILTEPPQSIDMYIYSDCLTGSLEIQIEDINQVTIYQNSFVNDPFNGLNTVISIPLMPGSYYLYAQQINTGNSCYTYLSMTQDTISSFGFYLDSYISSTSIPIGFFDVSGNESSWTACGNVSYIWNPGSLSGQTIQVVPDAAKSYTVTITTPDGCQVDKTIEVPKLNYECNIFIPNLITPNGDFKNDKFQIIGLRAGSALEIFNSWGECIFKTNDYQNDWDGSRQTDGIYYYILSTAGNNKVYKGWLEVLGK